MFIMTAKTSATKEADMDGGITQVVDNDIVSPITDDAAALGDSGDDEPDHPDIDDGDALDQKMETGELEDDMQASESLSMQIEHLQNLAIAIETYGISPGMMLVADRDGLLASTFIGKVPATESMVGPYKPDSITSQVALEGVMDAIKSKTAEWAAKAGGMIKSLATQASGMIKSAVSWTGSFAKSIANKTWDATKAAGATIKAHPYKTVLTVLAAIASAVAIFNMLAKIPDISAGGGQIERWKQNITLALGNIKTPSGKLAIGKENFDSTPVYQLSHITHLSSETLSGESPETGTVSALGWTKNALISTLSTLGRVLGKIGLAIAAVVQGVIAAIAHGVKSAMAGKIMRTTLRDAPKTGSRIANMAIGAIVFFVVKVTRLLINSVVRAGYSVINSTVKRVAKATFSH